jgi:hypothetical protein
MFIIKKGIIMKTLRHITLLIAIAMLPLLVSCEFTSTDQNDLKVLVLCTGGTVSSTDTTPNNTFSVTYIVDSHPPYSQTVDGAAKDKADSVLPAGNATKITITASKESDSATLTILVYNHGTVDDNGFANLPSCTISGTSTSCSNTLVLQYEVKTENTTDTKAATTTTTSSSSSSSSTQ